MLKKYFFYLFISLLFFGIGSHAVASTPAYTVSVTGTSPSFGPVGTNVSITGSGFSSLALPAGGDTYGDGVWFSDTHYSANLYTSNAIKSDNLINVVIPSMVCPGAESNSCSSNFSTPTSTLENYSIYIKNGNGSFISPRYFFSVTSSTTNQVHQAGTNIISGQQVYYIDSSCGGAYSPPTIRPYPSAAIFLSYPKNSWSAVVQANSDDLALDKGSLMAFAAGTLVNDKGTIYVMNDDGSCHFQTSSTKRGIPDANTFLSLGYQWNNVVSGDTSFMSPGNVISSSESHVPGTLINNKGTIYYVTQWGKIGITSMDEFNSKGFYLKNVVPANDKDRALQADPYGWGGPLYP